MWISSKRFPGVFNPVKTRSVKTPPWRVWVFSLSAALCTGVVIGRNAGWSNFWSARAIEVLQFIASLLIVWFAGYYLTERTSKSARRREIFYELLIRFISDLRVLINSALGFSRDSASMPVTSLFDELGRTVALGRHITKHANEFIELPFAAEFEADLQMLRLLIGDEPFTGAVPAFPDDWRERLKRTHRELDRRVYGYLFDVFR